ncbi:MAG: hypothetical protein KatS3mg077_1919 [Candidatus Binatia bacterium]|nr:MAG: hypothetical protein KatS3mg077_1919 [Candidatus Binatia bacterium]
MFACALPAWARVTFTHARFSDGMVLQAGMPNPIWGEADPGETVTVLFAGQAKTTVAAPFTGRWEVQLDPLPATNEGRQLTVIGRDNALQLEDVVVGEVWLCSGQSNMVINPPTSSELASYPLVRTFKVRRWGERPAGAAFWFGVALHEHLGIPVGIINQAVGGSNIRFWFGNSIVGEAGDGLEDRIRLKGRLYERKIEPLFPLALRGVCWWQGEADDSRPSQYAVALPALIKSWREDFGRPDLPFLFVQLPTGGGLRWGETAAPLPVVQPIQLVAPRMRDAYLKALALPGTGMVISIDLPGGTHPREKQLYGQRMASVALGTVYRSLPGNYSGPVFSHVQPEGNQLRIFFRPNTAIGLQAGGGAPLQGFAISNDGVTWVWARAAIQGSEVVVWHEAVPGPIAVRYAYDVFPRWANLFNGDGLAAAPFSSDAAPGPGELPGPSPTPTPTPTPSSPPFSPTRTATPTPTTPPLPSATPTRTGTRTRTPTVTLSPTFSSTPTRTPTVTPTIPLACSNGAPIQGALLRVLRNDNPAGDESLLVLGNAGSFFPPIALEVADRGLLVQVADRAGNIIFSRQLPGGSNWTVRQALGGFLFLYRDPSGTLAPGITKAKLISRDGTRVQFSLSGKNGNFQIQSYQLPLRLAVVFGDQTDGQQGRCGTIDFGTDLTNNCGFSLLGNTVLCR